MKESSGYSATVRLFFALIKSTLWQTPLEGLPFNVSSTSWNEIGKLATEQTVGGLVFNAMMSLPSELRPPKDWIFKACAFLERNRMTHRLIDKTAAEVSENLKNVGIRSVLLKGQAYARAYPDPTLRQCGDIDLYVGVEYYHKAYEASKSFGWKSEENFNVDAKHYGCSLNGVRIELHKIAGQLPFKAADKHFQTWSRQVFQSAGGELLMYDTHISVPTPIFDVVFVFLHMYHHFINGGIGLRQVCDWTMLLHSHAKEIDHAELKRLLEDFKLLKAWQMFAPIAVRYLGLPEKECPFYSPRYERKASRILNFIIKEGNFGRSKQKQRKISERYLARKVSTLKFLTSQYMSKSIIDPKLVLGSYLRVLRLGSKGIIEDLLGRK